MGAAQPLPALLQALSGELSDLHALACRLQDALPPTRDPRAMVGLQPLDTLTQTLDALSAYTQRLAAAVATGAPIDPGRAAECVPLTALALRLTLREAPPAPASGEFDAF